MNRFVGHINAIETDGAMSVVTVKVSDDLSLKCILLDTPETANYLVKDREVEVLFKETEVVIGLDKLSGVSLTNKIRCKVVALETGALLSSLELECSSGRIRSIISTRSARELDITPGKSVLAMIKLNELMLSPR